MAIGDVILLGGALGVLALTSAWFAVGEVEREWPEQLVPLLMELGRVAMTGLRRVAFTFALSGACTAAAVVVVQLAADK